MALGGHRRCGGESGVGSSAQSERLLHSLVGVEDMRASGEGSEIGAELVQGFQEVLGDGPLRGEQELSCSLPHSRRLWSECIIRPSVITSLNLPRTPRLPPPNLPYKFILLKKLKMSVFCEHCINELSPRMTEGGKEEEAWEDIPHFELGPAESPARLLSVWEGE